MRCVQTIRAARVVSVIHILTVFLVFKSVLEPKSGERGAAFFYQEATSFSDPRVENALSRKA